MYLAIILLCLTIKSCCTCIIIITYTRNKRSIYILVILILSTTLLLWDNTITRVHSARNTSSNSTLAYVWSTSKCDQTWIGIWRSIHSIVIIWVWIYFSTRYIWPTLYFGTKTITRTCSTKSRFITSLVLFLLFKLHTKISFIIILIGIQIYISGTFRSPDTTWLCWLTVLQSISCLNSWGYHTGILIIWAPHWTSIIRTCSLRYSWYSWISLTWNKRLVITFRLFSSLIIWSLRSTSTIFLRRSSLRTVTSGFLVH